MSTARFSQFAQRSFMLIRSLWRSSITATGFLARKMTNAQRHSCIELECAKSFMFLGATKSCNSRHNGFCRVSLDCMDTTTVFLRSLRSKI